MQISQSCLLLDACCVINLHASGHLAAILEAAPVTLAIPVEVHDRELLQTAKLDPLNPVGCRFQDVLDRRLLQVMDFQDQTEESAFIDMAGDLGDDGEAACFAIAANRGFAVTTDDKAARNYAARSQPEITLVYSLELVKFWAEKQGIQQPVIAQVLKNIRHHGRYLPRRTHPLHDWWVAMLGVS